MTGESGLPGYPGNDGLTGKIYNSYVETVLFASPDPNLNINSLLEY